MASASRIKGHRDVARRGRLSLLTLTKMELVSNEQYRACVGAGPKANEDKRMENAYNAKAYSAASETSPLASDTILRRNPTERDVQIEILFCGICHSDLHQVRNEWRDAMPTVYPCVPGHEIVGRVTKV